LTFGHDIEGNDIRQAATFHVLHDNPQISLHKEAVHEIDNVLVFAVLHHQNFVDNQVLLRLLLQVHLLDSHAFVAAHFVCRKNASRGTLSNLVELLVSQRRIGIRADGIELGNNIRTLLTLPRSLPWPGRGPDASLL
jgi:hypothetical protein